MVFPCKYINIATKKNNVQSSEGTLSESSQHNGFTNVSHWGYLGVAE